MKISTGFLLLLLALACTIRCEALSAGDVMVVGYDSRTAPNDAVSFVTWVELAAGETITVADAEYNGGGDGSGEGTGGGSYSGIATLVWENTTGGPIAPGTVIVLTDGPSANIGSASGSLGLTVGGEQFFLVQGTFNGSGNLIGTLLFGVDYENAVSWGESGESELPGALNVSNGNLSFGHISANEYQEPRSGLEFSEFPTEIMLPVNWSAPAASGVLLATNFQTEPVPEIQVPDRFGNVSSGLIFKPRRLNGALPIIDEAWMTSQGATATDANNIDGPSCVRIPDWVPAENRADPTAAYYLYFANHSGNFIRMAWATNVVGPWTGYRLDSALPLEGRGVLSLGTSDTISPGNGIVIDGHIASPQVLIDDVNQQFVMYYHGSASYNGVDKGQSTVVATSADGLNFNLPSAGGQPGHGTHPVNLGESYFRVFEQDGDLYAFSNTGDAWKAPDPLNPHTPPGGYDYSKRYWLKGPNTFTAAAQEHGWAELRPRHFAVLKRGNILYSFLTHKTDTPERVMVATFDFDSLSTNFNNWTLRFPEQEVMRAENDWEGAQFPPTPSEPGPQSSGVNQLRDPEVFEDTDGRVYLFYCGQGEDAIGLARLIAAPEISGEAEVVRGQAVTYQVGHEVDVTPAVRRISRSSPVIVNFDGEGTPLPFTYAGNGGYPVLQSQTVGTGTNAFQLAHLNSGDGETLTFPDRYYARPGAFLRFNTRLASATEGQVAKVQVSFDGTFWDTLWIHVGGVAESAFGPVKLDLDGLVGREFDLRFVYEHEVVLATNFVSGAGSSQGWFIDGVSGSGLESVQMLDEQAFAADRFTLADLSPWITPFLADGTGKEDRFLVSINGVSAGESTGFGKPFVMRVRTSYEQFQEDHFTQAEQANPAISGESADPDGDGLVNLLEHVYGTDPWQPNGGMVDIALKSGVAPVAPLIKFPWDPAANYTYQLQWSTNLYTFADIPFTQSASTNGGLLEIIAEPGSSIEDLGDAGFFRLKIAPE